MRPISITLKGFSSFREETTIDLVDTDLFALVGATGSGKSSVMDAMTWVLYGYIPRYGAHTGAALNSSSKKGAVSLLFEVDGQEYLATRDLVRTKTSATTKEARLERVDGTDSDGNRTTTVLASSVADVQSASERLLGLSYEEFTRVVMLPQGEFSEFLGATPGQRQDLLVNLLGVGVYREVGQRARSRASALSQKQGRIEAALDELVDATPEQVDELEARVGVLSDACDMLAKDDEEMAAIRERGAQLRSEQKTAQELVSSVRALVTPGNVESLGDRLSAAQQTLADATEAEKGAREKAEETRKALADYGDPQPVRNAVAAQERRVELRQRYAKATEEAEELTGTAESLRKVADAKQEELAEARAAAKRASTEHAAAVLADGLHAGDDCPTCHRELDDDPPAADTGAVEAAEQAVKDLEEQCRVAEKEALEAEKKASAVQSQARTLLGEGKNAKTAFGHAIEDVPAPLLSDDRDTIDTDLAEAWLNEWDRLNTAASQAADKVGPASAKVAAAQKEVAGFDEEVREAWGRFDRARDTVTALDPPSPDRDAGLVAAWDALVDWKDTAEGKAVLAEKDATAAVDAAMSDFTEVMDRAKQRAADVDVEVGENQTPSAAVSAAHGAVQSDLKRARKALERSGELTEELGEVKADWEVAERLSQHLNRNKFEKWALHKALSSLVTGASHILHDLSHGGYSLTLDDRSNFVIIDHTNADEERSTKSLSGGETFLTSLSLALALSEQVAAASASGARIESLFLDEGFGTLDQETLDVVTTAIEELATKNRLVGIISHVPELTNGRIPTTFQVTKTPQGSQVERIDA